jgi:hypothetical protein
MRLFIRRGIDPDENGLAAGIDLSVEKIVTYLYFNAFNQRGDRTGPRASATRPGPPTTEN